MLFSALTSTNTYEMEIGRYLKVDRQSSLFKWFERNKKNVWNVCRKKTRNEVYETVTLWSKEMRHALEWRGRTRRWAHHCRSVGRQTFWISALNKLNASIQSRRSKPHSCKIKRDWNGNRGHALKVITNDEIARGDTTCSKCFERASACLTNWNASVQIHVQIK